MDHDMRLKLGDRLSPPALRDQLDRVVLDRRRVQLGEPDYLRPGPGFGGNSSNGGPVRMASASSSASVRSSRELT
jgi:hypothetical protein